MGHAITDAKKSQDLPYAIWRTRGPGDLIRSESNDLRTNGANIVSMILKARKFGSWWHMSWSESRRPRNADVPWQKMNASAQAKRTHSPFLFYLNPQRTGWCLPTLVKAIFFTLLIKMLICSRNTLTFISRVGFYQQSCHSLGQSSWHIKINHHSAQDHPLSLKWSVTENFVFRMVFLMMFSL